MSKLIIKEDIVKGEPSVEEIVDYAADKIAEEAFKCLSDAKEIAKCSPLVFIAYGMFVERIRSLGIAATDKEIAGRTDVVKYEMTSYIYEKVLPKANK
ncbi:MAG: hypothetical protein WAX66_03945 [Patescibacteria group bacterium]